MKPNLLKPIDAPEATGHLGRSTSIIAKLHDMFGEMEFVKVINPDTEVHIWQYTPPEKERISFEGSSTTVPQKITERDAPETYSLDAGQSGVIPARSAYIMIDSLVKKLMAKRAISRVPNVEPGKARNFNFSDDTAQEQWIDQIYLGIVQPFAEVEPEPTGVDDDLGLDGVTVETPNVKRPGRPRKVPAGT